MVETKHKISSNDSPSAEKVDLEKESQTQEKEELNELNETINYDSVSNKRLVRKLDIWIMPLAIWSYLLAYLDRSNIGNAKVLNSDSGDDLLDVTGTSNYQYTSECTEKNGSLTSKTALRSLEGEATQ